ncbi:hypothetical protein PoB_003971900 [Plakobranchus ocellatus]|uniref:Uncharacterized protein n=1 Tax=Plakobranchus ocellatus TaxID=259542 RepID=A0AAV4B4B1_9GAST|nr:hypothetical protein PoB_003971900 [Plakobranchus ocellatus]
MWFIRRMMRIDVVYQKNDEDIRNRKKFNELILKEAKLERSLIKTIRQRQLQFLGYVCPHKGLEHLASARKIEGRRSRGRQRITFIESLSHGQQARVATTTLSS